MDPLFSLAVFTFFLFLVCLYLGSTLRTMTQQLRELRRRITRLERSQSGPAEGPGENPLKQTAEQPADLPAATPAAPSREKPAEPPQAPQAPQASSPAPQPLPEKRNHHSRQNLQEIWDKALPVAGLVLLVAGVSFLGIWASRQFSHETRFTLLVMAAGLCGGLALLFSRRPGGQTYALWFRSAAAAIYLFASLGAGAIPGIQFLENPTEGLLLLISGIAVNALIILSGAPSFFAALHIGLTLTALTIAPQTAITLFTAGAVTFTALARGFRRRADREHLTAVLLFFAYILYWGTQADTALSFYNLSALGVIGLLGAGNLALHYRTIYAQKTFETVPFLAHLTNWTFLAVGILRFAPDLSWAFLPLLIAGALLYHLARHAQTLGIPWLMVTDSLVAQMLWLLAGASLFLQDLPAFWIFFIIFFEVLILARVVPRRHSRILTAVTAWLLPAALLALPWGLLAGGSLGSRELAVFQGLAIAAVLLLTLFLRRSSSSSPPPAITARGYSLTGAAAGLLLLTAAGTSMEVFDAWNWPSFWNPCLPTLIPFAALAWIRGHQTHLPSWGFTAGLAFYLGGTSLFSLLDLFVLTPDRGPAGVLLFSLHPAAAAAIPALLQPRARFARPSCRRINPSLLALLLIKAVFLAAFLFSFPQAPPELLSFLWIIPSAACLLLVTSRAAAPSLFLAEKRIIPGLRSTILSGGILFLGLFLFRYFLWDQPLGRSLGQTLALPQKDILPLSWLSAATGLTVLLLWIRRRRRIPQPLLRRILLPLPETALLITAVILLQEGTPSLRPFLLALLTTGLLTFQRISTDSPTAGNLQPHLRIRRQISLLCLFALTSLTLILAPAAVSFPGSIPPWNRPLGEGPLLWGILTLALQTAVPFLAPAAAPVPVPAAAPIPAAAPVPTADPTARRPHLPPRQPQLSHPQPSLTRRRLLILLGVLYLSGFLIFGGKALPSQGFSLVMAAAVFVLFLQGLFLPEPLYRTGAQILLAGVLLRLLFFDLAHSSLLARAVVFIGTALLMLLMSCLHTQFRRRHRGPPQTSPPPPHSPGAPHGS